MLDQRLHKRNFVLFRSPFTDESDRNDNQSNDYSNQYQNQVHPAISVIAKISLHKTDIAPSLDIATIMNETPLLHNMLEHDMIPIKETLDLIVLLIASIDHHIDVAFVISIDLELFLETKHS